MLAAMVSERLGIDVTDCSVLEGDTDLTPVDLGSYSSRVTFMAGNAALEAANKLREKLLEAVAEKLECEPGQLSLEDGRIGLEGQPETSLDFPAAVVAAESKFGTLAFSGSYTPPKIGSRFRRQSVGPSPAYSFTAQVAEVEVDPETGVVTVERIWCAHDCGKAIHPTIVEGQMEGSVYMGFGEAMLEEQDYHASGLLRASSILEYRIPTVHDTPEIISILVESNDANGPLGAKEAGEGPQLATVPAIANAIHDATGTWIDTAPFTPERVLKALDKKAREAGKS
jgi:CO/xanthine dehydrogenase Mo-binding subunit